MKFFDWERYYEDFDEQERVRLEKLHQEQQLQGLLQQQLLEISYKETELRRLHQERLNQNSNHRRSHSEVPIVDSWPNSFDADVLVIEVNLIQETSFIAKLLNQLGMNSSPSAEDFTEEIRFEVPGYMGGISSLASPDIVVLRICDHSKVQEQAKGLCCNELGDTETDSPSALNAALLFSKLREQYLTFHEDSAEYSAPFDDSFVDDGLLLRISRFKDLAGTNFNGNALLQENSNSLFSTTVEMILGSYLWTLYQVENAVRRRFVKDIVKSVRRALDGTFNGYTVSSISSRTCSRDGLPSPRALSAITTYTARREVGRTLAKKWVETCTLRESYEIDNETPSVFANVRDGIMSFYMHNMDLDLGNFVI